MRNSKGRKRMMTLSEGMKVEEERERGKEEGRKKEGTAR